MPFTQLTLGATPGRRYGSFAGKVGGPATVPITQLGPNALPGQRYGSFAGKTGGGFPTQYAGLRAYYSGAVNELCLVAAADAPGGMGGVLKVYKNGVAYAVYIVETTDPNASKIRIKTVTGIKSLRLKT